MEKRLVLKLLKEKYGVCRLERTELIPEWAQKGDFYSISRTADELSIVCLEENIPNNIKCEKNWRILKVEGPLDFSLIGILASLSTILADEEISIFAISTYDTDYLLVKDEDLVNAVSTLKKEGYEIKL